MKGNCPSDRSAIKLRGTVPADHALNSRCYDVAPRVAFKLMLTLAAEACNTRDGLARLLTDDHPLCLTLRNMMPHEALAYLLGLTKTGTGRLVPEPKSLRDHVASNKSSLATERPVPASDAEHKEVGNDLDLDEDDFLSFGVVPAMSP